jgi:cytochrome c oxidase subunit IV
MKSPDVLGHDDEHRGATAHHGPTLATYYAIFGGLIALTLLTVGAAYAEFLPAGWHTPVAFLIAAAKATLVLLFFMHLWYSPRLTWLIAFGSLVWLAIIFALTFADYLTRKWLLY